MFRKSTLLILSSALVLGAAMFITAEADARGGRGGGGGMSRGGGGGGMGRSMGAAAAPVPARWARAAALVPAVEWAPARAALQTAVATAWRTAVRITAVA